MKALEDSGESFDIRVMDCKDLWRMSWVGTASIFWKWSGGHADDFMLIESKNFEFLAGIQMKLSV